MPRPGRYWFAPSSVRVVARLLAITAVTVAAVTVPASAATALPAPAAGGLTCRYTPIEWPGGFTADLAIFNNTATAVNGWTASWNFQHPTRVTSTWNGSISQSTEFDATGRNTHYNAVIRPGSSATLGWTATAPATEIPAEIIVNGTRCPVG